MIRCPNCGEENPERAKFCLNCANPLSPAPATAGEVRKTVTILFADIVSSTSRGEQTDPESTRRMLARYFEAMRRVIDRHEGTVEKFIGDAVMAVFGIPTLHEDDALRAVRAANEIRSAVELLNQELAGTNWPPVALRTGVNTGEVVTGDAASGATLVTGDAVNVAARLEQAAAPGEVVLGASTYRLVREAIEAEPMQPLEVKGKAEPVHAFRLVSVAEREPMRRHETPMVGRQRELRLLREAFARAREEQECHLFTLLGTAGVGKSRLVHEFLGEIRDQAIVLRARCLPYGEGITFWPVIELAQAAASIDMSEAPESARERLAALLADAPEREGILQRIAATIGLSDEVVPTEEAFWGVRKFLEAIASTKPLVAVIDDLHWAEPTMLDLIDHIADWSREAPILLLAIARPELVDARPGWGGGKMNATTILLEPLGPDDSAQLVANLLQDESLAKTVQQRIGETAEGNPLFVEELVAMLVDQGVLTQQNGGWKAAADLTTIAVPPSIAALVAARLDHLGAREKDLIGRASVVGKIFQRSAVSELSPPDSRSDLGTRLMTLVRKELVRPDRSSTTGDEAFRFRHLLVRDAAYASLTKEQRADLHARFADWLERIAGDRLTEYEEVIGYHLEQAAHYRTELGLTDELTAVLRSRSFEHLRAAGLRALARDDASAARSLLSRAALIADDEHERGEILLQVAPILFEMGNPAEGLAAFERAKKAAMEAGDEELSLRAELNRLDMMMMTDPSVDEEQVLARADELEALATRQDKRLGRIAAELARATVSLNACHWQENLAALERARELMKPQEDPKLWRYVHSMICNSLCYGPVSAPEAIERIQAEGLRGNLLGTRETWLAHLTAMRGNFDEARTLLAKAFAYMDERGLTLLIGASSLHSGAIEMLAGDFEAAERALGNGVETLRAMGETGVLSTLAGMRAEVLYRLGRLDEVSAAIKLARESGSPEDIATQAQWRIAGALTASDTEQVAEAIRLMGEAIDLVEPTDFLEIRADAFEALAHIEGKAGRLNAWRAALDRALAEYEGKGNLVGTQRVRGLIREGPATAFPKPGS